MNIQQKLEEQNKKDIINDSEDLGELVFEGVLDNFDFINLNDFSLVDES